jgi:membrane protein YqaA with SNARE-associated domain
LVGDPLTLVAGVARIELGRFLFWTFLGRLARYGVVAALALGALRLFG